MVILLSSILLLLSDVYPPFEKIYPFPQFKNTVTARINLFVPVLFPIWNNDASWIVEYTDSEHLVGWLNVQSQLIADAIRVDYPYCLGDFYRHSMGAGYMKKILEQRYIGAYLYYDYSDHKDHVIQAPGKATHCYQNHTINIGVEGRMNPYRLVINGYLCCISKQRDIRQIYGALYPQGGGDIKLTIRRRAITTGLGAYLEKFSITGAQADVYPPQPFTVKGFLMEAVFHYKPYGLRMRYCYDNVYRGRFYITGHWMKGSNKARHQPIERHIAPFRPSSIGWRASKCAENYFNHLTNSKATQARMSIIKA